MNQNIQTVAEIARKRIIRLKKQESNIQSEIERIHKKLDNIPQLKEKLEELKQKKKSVVTRRTAELKEIEQLTKLVSEGGLTFDTEKAVSQ